MQTQNVFRSLIPSIIVRSVLVFSECFLIFRLANYSNLPILGFFLFVFLANLHFLSKKYNWQCIQTVCIFSFKQILKLSAPHYWTVHLCTTKIELLCNYTSKMLFGRAVLYCLECLHVLKTLKWHEVVGANQVGVGAYKCRTKGSLNFI